MTTAAAGHSIRLSTEDSFLSLGGRRWVAECQPCSWRVEAQTREGLAVAVEQHVKDQDR